MPRRWTRYFSRASKIQTRRTCYLSGIPATRPTRNENDPSIAPCACRAFCTYDRERGRLSAGNHRDCPACVSAPGERQPDRAERQGGRLGADRAAVQRPEVLLGTALRDRRLPVQRFQCPDAYRLIGL